MIDPADKLNAAIDTAIANTAWKSSSDGTTHCNEFCQEILHAAGCTELDGLDARDMGQHVVNAIERAGEGLGNWQEVTAMKAVDLAKSGRFVLGWSPILEETHGHVVIVAPEDMEDSGTFGGPVPMVASIAKFPFENRIMKVSEAYRIANKPRYFLWQG